MHFQLAPSRSDTISHHSHQSLRNDARSSNTYVHIICICSLYCFCSKLELAKPSGPLSSGVVSTSPGCRFDACIRPMGSGNLKYAPKYIPHAILVNVHAAAEGAKLLWQLRGQVAEPCNFFLQNAAMHKTHKHELFQHVYKKKEKPAMFRPLTQQPSRGLIYFQHLKPFNRPCCFN